VIVIFENQDYATVIGSPAMPYFNRLASRFALATNFFANTHPSQPNYFMLTTGQLISDSDSFVGVVDVDNVVRQLVKAGKTWKSYAESLPSVGYIGGDVLPYVKRHNPFAYFSDVINNPLQIQNLVPFSQFQLDMAAGQLPNYSFIIPNQVHNAHDCPDGSAAENCPNAVKLAAADDWLRVHIDPLLANPQFQQSGLLIVTWDEASFSDTAHGGGRIAVILAGPKVRSGFQSITFYQHESVLRLSLEALGLTSIPGAGATAPVMDEFFQ